MNKNTILTGVAAVAIIVTGFLIFANQNPSKVPFNLSVFGFGQPNDAIAKKAMDYLNNTVLAGQSQASLAGVSEESGLVKIKIKIGANEYDSYATKDGKLLFPQAFKMEPGNAGNENQNPNSGNSQLSAADIEKAKAEIKKTANPVLDAYVVSRCPFGLQMQRVMADIVEKIPDLAKNLKVKYIGSVSASGDNITAMHGEAEAKENFRQICIREEQPSKYWPYTACQMKSGDTAGCEKSTGVDSGKMQACMSDKNRGVAYAKKDFDSAGKYSVQGSPTLILGDAQVSEFNFGGRTSEAVKTIICSAFSSEPGSCSNKLNTAEAATSFSEVYASGNSNSGNSGNTGANCAPAQ